MPIKKCIKLPELTKQQVNNFWNKVEIKPNGCWEWQGARKLKAKYGVWKPTMKSPKYYTHRIAYFIYYAKDPFPLCVCHSCDNPPCVNPFHLWTGTTQDNSKDMVRKNRGIKGCSVPMSKLTEKDVLYIRSVYSYRSPDYNYYALAKKFNVQPSAIFRVVQRKTWKHI